MLFGEMYAQMGRGGKNCSFNTGDDSGDDGENGLSSAAINTALFRIQSASIVLRA